MDHRHERRLNVEYLNTRMGASLAEHALTGGARKDKIETRAAPPQHEAVFSEVETAD